MSPRPASLDAMPKILHIHGLAPTIIGAIFLGFLLPLALGLILTLRADQARMEKEFLSFQENALEALSLSVEDALASFSPDSALNASSVLIHDDRIVEIDVYSSLFGMYLAKLPKDVSIPPENRLTRRKIIKKDGEELGYVEMTVDHGYVASRVAQERRRVTRLFMTMFVIGLILAIPILYVKILRPLALLSRQARMYTAGNLETAYEWRGRDELSELGRTLEAMREALLENFRRIHDLATRDELTGALNRRAFFEKTQDLVRLANRHGWPLTVAMFDLDHFKTINDVHGHKTGDDVLSLFTRIVTARIRSSDVFARFGGEEFILCMPQTPLPNALVALEDLRATVEKSVFPNGARVTVSAGLAAHVKGAPLEAAIENADKALYAAKNAGRNRVILASDAPAD